ncbi:MAG: ECF transporter S component [Lachnospiraceae bacterium]|jgi:Predicted membrane protein|nr:ECF transporter S component [Lachnospiraceae bacterium]
MENNKKMNTMYMVEMALLIAIILIMAFTPIGYIRTFGLEITLIVVPVAVGAVTLGPTAGAVLGAVFGITSFIQCFGMSPFGAVLLSINPIYTFIVCVLSRILMGGLTGLLYKIFQKSNPLKKISVMLANLCCPILNTLFFMGTLTLFFYRTEYIQGIAQSMGAGNPFIFVILFVGVNGVVEAVACFVAGSAISQALKKVVKRN